MHNQLQWAKDWLQKPKNLYANGAWFASASGRTTVLVNPATEEVLTKVCDADKADVDKAVTSAHAAFSSWGKCPRKVRQEALKKIGELIRTHREELATLETLQNGKTFKESFYDDLPESADVFDYYAGWIDKVYGETSPVENGFLNYTKREPIGVMGLIVPWNFPLLLAAWKIAPALAFGNTVVVKPSPFTPLTLLRLCELIHQARILPPGVFNLVTGENECGEALTQHALVSKVSFTGSTSVGKKIASSAALSNLKAVALELGGKSPNILFEDTPNFEGAVQRQFTAMFSHKGEKCSEPTRLLVHESLYEKTLEKLKILAQAVKLGDPFSPDTEQGPQCHKAHYDKVIEYIRIGIKEGARLVAGGEPSKGKGYFIGPTIFADTTPQMRIVQEEIFGPVLVVQKFSTEEEAITLANNTPYGLAAGFYTADVSRSNRVADALQAGMVFVNHYGCYDFASPFGGTKQSGWGHEMGVQSLDAFTKRKSVWVKYGE